MAKLFFSKEEKLTLENNVLKENNLQMQMTILQGERQNLITDFCRRNSKSAEEVTGVNLQEGSVEFSDKGIESKKKRESKS